MSILSNSNQLQIVNLTDNAIIEVKRRIKEVITKQEENTTAEKDFSETGLRLGVKGGGCSGLSYVIDFGKFKEKDYTDDSYGFKIFIDPKSSLYLKGVTLEYDGGFMGNGFKFINPQATNTCGCGESFAI